MQVWQPQGEDREGMCLCVCLPTNHWFCPLSFCRWLLKGLTKILAFLEDFDFTGALHTSTFLWGRRNQEALEPIQLILILVLGKYLVKPDPKYFLKYSHTMMSTGVSSKTLRWAGCYLAQALECCGRAEEGYPEGYDNSKSWSIKRVRQTVYTVCFIYCIQIIFFWT